MVGSRVFHRALRSNCGTRLLAAECELAVCGKLKVQDARRHIQEKKAQQTFCFCHPILQVVRHIRLTADILQKVDAVGYRRLAEWRKAERYANFSFRHGKARCAGNREREKYRPQSLGPVSYTHLTLPTN